MRRAALVLSLACALSLFAQTSPEWKKLEAGNGAFQGSYVTFDKLDVLRSALANGQKPAVTVLSCSDSRVPPELVFRQNLGDIFVVRSAGNVTDSLGIASIEYAIIKGWTQSIVVLAHEKCGAVEEAMKPRPKPDPDNHNLLALIDTIHASFKGDPPECRDPKRKDQCWAFRAKENALYTVTDLQKRSPIIRRAIQDKKVSVVVGYYELKSGKVVVLK
ncbi:MAG TPA: carbonic anhydrase [Thermoanaerobaculia bacterium]|jgi:carbonic anhydrase|nr:carbonic anhydrase [Thermoanaerobaculia bacterium]